MSRANRNGKLIAHERRRAERAAREILAKRRRRFMAFGLVPAVVTSAVITGVVVQTYRSQDDRPALAPLGTVAGGKAIEVGAEKAPATLEVYEDFRCPACQAAEARLGEVLQKYVQSGRLRLEYHPLAAIDAGLGGKGSLRAANAVACAQDLAKFAHYHAVLFSNQPEEKNDRFADRAELLRLAENVPGLRTPAFEQCVKKGTHEAWVRTVTEEFRDHKFRGTPAMLLNGKQLDGHAGGAMASKEAFEGAVLEAVAEAGGPSPSPSASLPSSPAQPPEHAARPRSTPSSAPSP
ncbi:thioredoxin domain-containing protein [Kitasatospora sp. NPDC056731]|uniref:DsbA family protein n=1 Tax=Kitasatospora sp. NPDC056731 TaxID=3155422 RepID=UPI0034427675